MADANGFLGRIRADPDDDALRAVYADWLIEQGDVRGEFIALQLKRARNESTPDDARRERELLSRHWYAWSGPLAGALHRDESTFERGFLTHVTMPRVSTPQKLLNSLVGDPHWATVRTVRNVHINKYYQRILLHPVMHRLTSASMDDGELVQLAAAPWKLKELALRAWDVRAEHAQILREAEPFSKVVRLQLQTNSLEDLGRLADTVKRLERLELFLAKPREAEPILKLLATKGRVTTVEAFTFSLSVTAGRLDIAVSDYPRGLETLSTIPSLVRSAGFTPGQISWSTKRKVDRPADWSTFIAPFERVGFQRAPNDC